MCDVVVYSLSLSHTQEPKMGLSRDLKAEKAQFKKKKSKNTGNEGWAE